MGISRQSVYQAEGRYQARVATLLPVLDMVTDIRRFMPRLGTRKLGRDGLFDYLREHQLLVKRPRHYLSLVTDAYSRKIMGHDVSQSMTAADIGRALKQAITGRLNQEPLFHHSDRGSQYCSQAHQTQLVSSSITPSMTDGYDGYQNALAERINGILKHEFLLTKCKTGEELKRAVRQSIAIYNEYRPHLSLGIKTPNEVHKKASCEMQLA